jgi:hypothetical protein
MGLAEKLTTTPKPQTGLPCSIGALLARLEGAERDALNAMLYELGWSARRIYDACASEGYDVGQQTINRHRSQSCRCFKVVA